MKFNFKYISKYIFVPIILFIIGTLTLFNSFKTDDFGFLTLDTPGTKLAPNKQGQELLLGETLNGKFHSNYPNLGILSIRFYNQDRDSNDTLVFRLREEGQSKWYYEGKYQTDQFLPHKHFPFGFPIIKDSTSKNYEFQIQSLRGATGSGIFIDYDSPVFIAKSSFTKNELLGNKRDLIYFTFQKVTNVFSNPEIIRRLVISYIPLLFYLLYLVSSGISYQFLTISTLVLVGNDIFMLQKGQDILYLSIVSLWLLISKRFNFESKISATISLIFLVITPFLIALKLDVYGEKTAIWAYLFLCITAILQIYELKFKPKKQLTLKMFLSNFTDLKIDKTNAFARLLLFAYKPSLIVLIMILAIDLKYRVFETFSSFNEFYTEKMPEIFVTNFAVPILTFTCLYIFVILYLKNKVRIDFGKMFVLVVLYHLIFSRMNTNITAFKDLPRIFSINPVTVTEAWTDVVIMGKNFRDIPFQGKVFIDGVEQGEYLVSWSDSKIIFRTNPKITKSGKLKVSPVDRPFTNELQFNYNYK